MAEARLGLGLGLRLGLGLELLSGRWFSWGSDCGKDGSCVEEGDLNLKAEAEAVVAVVSSSLHKALVEVRLGLLVGVVPLDKGRQSGLTL